MVEQAAELLGVSRRTVYYRIRDGRLHTVRTMGGSQRVLLVSIERMLREGVRRSYTRHQADLADGPTGRGAAVSDRGPFARFQAP